MIKLRLKLLKVAGNSMHPAIASGVFVLVWHWSVFGRAQRLKVGDVVAVDHPIYGQIIKRISAIDSQLPSTRHTPINTRQNALQFRLRGDNTLGSVSEADMGWVAEQALIGKVVYVVKVDG